ncbi:unnamed protein product [Rodentolepis nana]|uniref:Coronin n=1 Tax=Rodentolepis nana TaxID=102285 RepID=A0A0R3TVJ7_RODNA|nr:unnamed protein product [Rodentolepis nana]
MTRSILHSPSPIWIPAGAESSFEGVPISNAFQYGHLAACSEKYLAVATGFNAGGLVALLDLSKPGRYDGDTYYRAQCHSNSVTDLAWNKSTLATSSLDKTVKLWRAQTRKNETTETPVLEHLCAFQHKDRVVNIAWSPNNPHLLATALYGRKVSF